MSETTQEQKAPTKEELITFFKDQIEVKELQARLQQLNRDIAVHKAEELKALEFVAQIMNPQAPQDVYKGGQLHTLTEEDMTNNPELAEQGLKAGDEVMIPTEVFEEAKEEKKKTLKKK